MSEAKVSGDPRLAVAREKIRVDQATAVFSTRALKEAEVSATAPEGTGGVGEGASTTSAPSATAAAVETADVADVADTGETEGTGGKGDARLRAAVAAWVRGADDEGGDKGGVKGEEASEEADVEPEDASEAEPEDEPEDESAAEGASGKAAGEPAEKPEAEKADGEPEGEPDAGGAPEKANEAAEKAEEASAEAEDASGKAESDASEKAGSGASKKAEGDAPKKAEGDASTEDAAEEPPPVDQPTAIFKAVRRPAVDQPTTMLKLGSTKPAGGKSATDKSTENPSDKPATAKSAEKPSGKPADKSLDESTGKPSDKPADKSLDESTGKPSDKPADKPADKSTDKSAAESPAERTSKFVALKPLDEPASAKPKAAPAPGAAASGATATGARGTTAPRPAVSPAEATAAIPQVGPERTTQQPLPPKPPLDLLAELTNTPPPPQTPVRTMVRRVKIWTPLLILLIIVFAVAQAVRPLPTPTLGLTANETYTFEGGKLDLPWPGQGQSAVEVEGVGTVGTAGKQAPKPIASVAKIMTAYVILEEHPLKGTAAGDKITVDQQAEDESKNEDESTAAMTKGQKFTERQMLQMLMIPSGNNAARLLARWDSDSKTFVGKMNAAAKKLGMTNSTYTDPSGLEKTTVSTATDQLKLAKAVMQKDVFRSIVGMAKADIPGLKGTIYNNNDLLVKQVGVIGLKTGSSTPAGGNLVWAATKTVNGKVQTIYGAVLNQDAGTGRVWDSLQLALTNSQKLIDKVQQGLISARVVKKGQVVGYVDDQLGGRTPVVATENMTAVGWPGLKTKISIGAGDKTVPHEAKAGKVVGELTVGDGSSHAVTIPVALQSDLAEPGYGAKFTRVS
ncbi:D-alanyl-D-alanine carboxypeptidase [Streptomyces avermitilis]|uniref:D-alanyl-D-alanine carboxypeptidase n=1 Tax=Streptomyces avermitilis TaxID=33903 RepID=UPI003813A26A